MILLDWGRSNAVAPGVVLLFGSGLIGGEVANAFCRSAAGATSRRFNWSWSGPEPAELEVVETAARDALANRKSDRLAVIWAAGRSGFGTDEEGMAKEFDALKRVVETARLVGAELPPERRCFVHISSAGGLFEGQVACGCDTPSAPLRPYAHGKLAQEKYIVAEGTLGRRLIVRPSSVYGYSPGARRGLISALVAAGIQRGDATIFGSLTTQRDFVFAPDVGRFITSRLLEIDAELPKVSSEMVILASGRPASVFEVIQLVQDRLGTALHLKIDPRPENARDNTFLPSALPQDFRPTGLREGVALTVTAMIQKITNSSRI